MNRLLSFALGALTSVSAAAQNFTAAPALPDFPVVYQTTEYAIQVDKIADGLSNPWSLAFLPNGDMLVTERAGNLRLIRDGVLVPEPIAGVPEVKIMRAGANYGWPLVTHGRDYDGTVISASAEREDLESPFMIWIPSIAVSGLSFYTGDAFPLWRGNLFVGSMVMGRTPMTGHVQRIAFSDEGVALAREPLLQALRQRIRDVRSGPDGLLYVLTDHAPGAVLRISPAAE